MILLCAAVATAAFLLNVRRKRAVSEQPLHATLRHYICVTALYVLGRIQRRRLYSLTQNVAEAQKSFLLRQLQENASTDYGKKYGFAAMTSVQDFVRGHPLTRYQHYLPYIQRMLRGERKVLTEEDPVMFGVSSGTCGEGCKTIPTLKRQRLQFFLHAVCVLYCCLLDALPETGARLRRSLKIFYDPSTWRATPTGIKIGPSSSTPASMRGLLHVYSTPGPAFQVVSEPEALYLHLLFALRDRQLGMIEANFASLVHNALNALCKDLPDLAQDIAQGTLSSKLDIPRDVRDQLEALLQPDPARAEEILQAFDGGVKGLCRRLWPALGAVLAADSGTFAPHAARLRAGFLQGVTLYSPVYAATEGLVGVNLWPAQLPSRYLLHPALHFFEFIPAERFEEEQPSTVLLHQVEEGAVYEVVVTNVSGLCRYRLGDVVRVTGFHDLCPVVEFLYRLGQFLNVRGEKTSEATFFEALSAAVAHWSGVTLKDYCCAESVIVDDAVPQRKDIARDRPCYHVFLELEGTQACENDTCLTERQKQMVDDYLCEKSYVYSSFRAKGSIGAMQVHVLRTDAFRELRDYVLSTTEASSNQYKVPRVLKRETLVAFMLARTVGEI